MLEDGRVQDILKMLKGGQVWSLEVNSFKQLIEHENLLDDEMQRIRVFTSFEIERKDI
jgi:hypothetical protein